MKAGFVVLILLMHVTLSLHAQHKGSSKDQAAFGIGLGLPYGGIGAKLSVNPADQLTLFGGLGYSFSSVGLNGGFLYSFPSTTQAELYVTGMYGLNAFIDLKGSNQYQTSFSGPSFGFGFKINSLRREGAYWDVSLLLPVRSTNYKDTLQDIKWNSAIELTSEPWPVLISFGYNIPLGSNK